MWIKDAQTTGGSPGDSVLARSSLALMIGVQKAVVQRDFLYEKGGNKDKSQDVMWFENTTAGIRTDAEKKESKRRDVLNMC